MITIMPSLKSRTVLAALQRAVDKTLDKKEKLGQYAVIWQNGEVVLKGADVSRVATPGVVTPGAGAPDVESPPNADR
jgi:hypothetical protein